MGTKTIGLQDDAYERLKARKREDESFTDLVNRLLDESTPNWREGFGTLPEDETAEFKSIAEQVRRVSGEGLAVRQEESLAALEEVTDDEEAP